MSRRRVSIFVMESKTKFEACRAPRVAASSYLNTAPLIWSFQRGTRQGEIELLTDRAPARSAELLARREVEAALVPVIEYQRMPDVRIVPGVCVGSRRRVRSVVLVTNGMGLSEVETVALDVSSRTSAALVQIVFREFIGRAPLYFPAAPDIKAMLETHDAALLIGDPAMTVEAEGRRVFDLATVWREHTGLGFVFAVWMINAHLKNDDLIARVDWRVARDEGLRHTEDIITAYETDVPLPRDELRTYLRDNICYDLDDELLAGLKLFYRLAHTHELIPCVRPLEMFK